MDIITYALSKKGIINVDGKQYKPELKDGEIVYKKIEEPGDYTTFTVGEAGELEIANVSNASIEELYINNIPQELPVGAYYYETTNYNVKTNDIIKIKGRFSLSNDGLRITNIILQNDLTNCDYMFAGCAGLTEAPIIPNSVTSCINMFSGCTGLTEAPVIPSSVTSCDYMFQSCIDLTKAPEIPSSVISCSWMFQRCMSLTEAPIIPANVMDCSYMFQGCENLTTIPQANINLMDNPPATLVIYDDCYSDCTNIVNPISYDEIPQAWGGNKVEKPEIPTREYTTFTINRGDRITISIEDVAEPAITELYINGEQQELPEHEKRYFVEEGQEVKIKGHFRLRDANIINVKLQSNLTDCNRMFEGCGDLLIAPEIPEGVTNCESMFNDCRNLLIAPIIPSTVTNCRDMFNSCENLEKLPQENINLMYNHPEELNYFNCYGGCEMIRDIVLRDWGGERSQEEEMPEKFGEYTTFIIREVGNMRISIEDVTEPPIMELYIDGERQELPGHESDYMVGEGQEVKIKGHFKLRDANIARVKLQSNLTDCYYMFEGARMKVAPEIPSTVTNCENMFRDCSELVVASVIPNSVTKCRSMFEGCGDLLVLPQENVDLMYKHNDELEHEACYRACDRIIDPITYSEIPDDWK